MWFITLDVNQVISRIPLTESLIRERVKWFSYDRFLSESAHFIFQSSGLWSDCRLSSSPSLQATQRRPSGPMGGLIVARGHVWSADSWPAHNIHPDGLFSPEPDPQWSHCDEPSFSLLGTTAGCRVFTGDRTRTRWTEGCFRLKCDISNLNITLDLWVSMNPPDVLFFVQAKNYFIKIDGQLAITNM